MLKSHNIIATPPGATIKEQLCDRQLSQKEFARRMDMSEKHISNLINGKVHLTPDVAIRLETVLGIPAKFWNNLEAIYRSNLLKAEIENDMEEDIEFAKKFPYNEMMKNGWIQSTTKTKEKVQYLRSYFEVVKLSLIFDDNITRIACRKLSKTEKSDYALLAWVQQAKKEAKKIETSLINIEKLNSIISDIRSMTTMDPKQFCPILKKWLAGCGIALVFLPHIGGSFLHGATFYDGKKIVIGLTVRGKDADKFWFSLFHELAHVIYGHLNHSGGVSEEDEKEADNFAKNTLIPKEKMDRFISAKSFSRKSIINFSNEEKIDPGIVVGRLQKENWIEYSMYNDMKKKYKISN